ncbi:MAG: metal-sensitive transcriptional regulator [Candidatus Buchananbacteria bacterium]
MSKQTNHLHRIAGQVTGIEKMLQAKKSCGQVMAQILAARASLAKLAREVIKEECENCSKKELESLAKELFKIT